MSPPMPRSGATVLVRLRAMSLGVLCLVMLVSSQWASHRLTAQEPKKSELQVFLSFKKDGVRPAPRGVELRPNVEQEVYVYVLNSTGAKQSATVDLLSDGKVVYTGAVKDAPSGAATLVEWPAAAPPAKDAPAQELALPLTLRVKDKDGGERQERVVIARAIDYLKVERITYSPPEEKKVGGRLEMAVARDPAFPFAGPAAGVEVDLRPELIMNYEAGKGLKGSPKGNVSADGQTVVLDARDLRFTRPGYGFVNVTVDKVPRALMFRAQFPLLGNATSPIQVTAPVLATSLPRYSKPLTDPMPLTVEAGGLIDDAYIIKVERLADAKEGTYSEVASFTGPRQEKVGFGKTGPTGGLLFTPAVRNWTTPLNLSGLTGSTKIRLRLLNAKMEPLNVLDGSRPYAGDEKASKEVVQDITIDDAPPALVEFMVEGKKPRVVRGRKLVVQATCTDAESKVTKVVFYLGKRGPDGNMPPGVPKSEGVAKGDIWKGEFQVPSDAKGPLDVSVVATDIVGNEATQPPISVQVVEPDPTDGTIRGRVYEKEVALDNIKVRLYSDKGKLRQIVRTKDGGQFTFEKLQVKDGKYRIVAKRETNNASAETEVEMKEYKAQLKDNQPLELNLQTPEAKGAKKASISGVVREGDRPQAGLVVTLTDAAANKPLLTVKSSAEGKYEFKELNPGKYKVSASKSASQTKGETKPEDLKAGEAKTGVDIKLYR